MFLVRELSFRFCYIVLFGHDHCRRTFISRFNNDKRVSLERLNRHQLRFRQITHTVTVLISYRDNVFQLFQYFIYILILARWIPGRFGSKVFFGFGRSGAVKKYRRWVCLAKRLMDACMSSKSLVCGVGINCSPKSKISAWISYITR